MSEARSATKKAMVRERSKQYAQNEEHEDKELLDLIRRGPSTEHVREGAISAVRSLQENGSITEAVAHRLIDDIEKGIAENGV